MSFRLEFRSRARRRLAKLAKRSLQIAKDVHAKITWLAESADVIKHDRLKGRQEYSLHCGQYRSPIRWTE